MRSDEEYLAIRERAAERLQHLPGIIGVGIGGKERGGKPTGEVAIKVVVKVKRPPEEVPAEELVPAEFEGVPTDVFALGPVRLLSEPPPPGKLPMTEAEAAANTDKSRQRPLVGGCQIESKLVGSAPGTLGCLMTDLEHPGTAYTLTNFHVIDSDFDNPTRSTRVGQPTNRESATRCCSGLFGTFAGGGASVVRDAALVKLDGGIEWKAEILDIGVVRGRAGISPTELAGLNYQVRKRGIATQLTGGIVVAIHQPVTFEGRIMPNCIVIRPNPDSADPDTQMFFADSGDSGAVVVNDANEVVGLLFGVTVPGIGPPEPPLEIGAGIATPIVDVIEEFILVEGIRAEVATATDSDVVHKVAGPPAVPLPAGVDLPAEVGAAPAVPGLDRLQADLDRSRGGRLLISMWLEHQRELNHLVNSNRRVAVVWHRSGAAAVFQILLRALSSPLVAVPSTINGEPFGVCLDRVHQVFRRYASPGLQLALDRCRAALPDLGGLTYPQIIAALGDDRS